MRVNRIVTFIIGMMIVGISSVTARVVDFNNYIDIDDNDMINEFVLYHQTTNQYTAITNNGIDGSGCVEVTGDENNTYTGEGLQHQEFYTNMVGSTIYLSGHFKYNESLNNPFDTDKLFRLFLYDQDTSSSYGIYLWDTDSNVVFFYVQKMNGSSLYEVSLTDGNWYRCVITLESTGGAWDENIVTVYLYDCGPNGDSPPSLIITKSETVGISESTFQGVISGTRKSGCEYIDNYEISYDPSPAIPPIYNGPTLSIQNGIEINWVAITNTQYQVQWSDQLTSNVWNNLGPVHTGYGLETTQLDSMSGFDQKFYRIVELD